MDDINELYALLLLFGQTRHMAFKVRQKELDKYGITPRQAAVLHIIPLIGKKATPAEISRWLGRESHTVSSNLNTMERQGLIKKTKDLDKRNLVRITLTRKGRRAVDQAMELHSVETLLGRLTKMERTQFRSILEKIRNAAIRELKLKDKVVYPEFLD